MNRQILRLAVPNIITNITVPLLGMVDTAIAGHLDTRSDSLDYIGAIAVGTMIFNIIYWNFGFLRMGTSGFTAQAYGANDVREQTNILTRACSVALISALLLIVLQKPISVLAASLIEDRNSVVQLALTYFFIRIWAAPATLGMYALKGWFIGMQDSRTPMWISILINILNIGFSLLFVVGYGMNIDGVAWGTVVAQYGGLITTVALWLKKYGSLKRYINIRLALQWDKLKMFFKVNSDIFLRTICLVLVTSYFTVASSSMPYPTLAVNTILMQLFTLFSYFMDGFAYAAESLCGKFKGAGDYANLRKSVSQLLKWGAGLSMSFVVLYFFGAENILGILTDKQDIIDKSGDYIFWVLLIPVTGFVAFLYDGILIGMTETVLMRNAIFIATALFFVLFFSLKPLLGNDALWIGFIVYLSARSILMAVLSRRKIFIHG